MEICPQATWLQYVNPMCSNMIAIKKVFPDIKSIGLCHSVQGTAEMLAKDLGEKIEDIEILRFLERGIDVKVVLMKKPTQPVDVSQDLIKVKNILLKKITVGKTML